MLGNEIVVGLTSLSYGGNHVTCCLWDYKWCLNLTSICWINLLTGWAVDEKCLKIAKIPRIQTIYHHRMKMTECHLGLPLLLKKVGKKRTLKQKYTKTRGTICSRRSLTFQQWENITDLCCSWKASRKIRTFRLVLWCRPKKVHSLEKQRNKLIDYQQIVTTTWQVKYRNIIYIYIILCILIFH